jgi:hypothetical protein
MKKLLLSLVVLASFGAKAQVTIFEDSFEFYDDFAIANVGDWTLTDVDLKLTYGFQGITFPNSGVAKSFQVFNATTTTPALTPSATSNWTARTGDKHMVCFAASQPTAAPLNNDWLISPQITLGTSNNTVTFWAKSCDASFGVERFKVGVSTTDAAPVNFTIISPGAFITTTPAVTWAQYTYNLDAYAGQAVYIGINCVSNDQFGFAVDDFKVEGTVLATTNFVKNNFSVTPNPASDVININKTNTVAMTSATITDINGRVVKTVNSEVAQINISDLTAGVYMLNIVTAQGSGTTKIVKK